MLPWNTTPKNGNGTGDDSFLLLESGDDLLCEDGDMILLEQGSGGNPWINTIKN